MKKLSALYLIILFGFNHGPVTVNNHPLKNKNTGSPYPVIYTNLMVNFQGNLTLTDGVATGFDNRFSAAVDGDDAIKLWNFGENIALVRDNETLALELRPVPVLNDTSFYRLYLKQRPYTLQIYTQQFESMFMRAWLVDKYLNTKTEVNLHDTTLYNFIPNKDTNSYRNRFMLVYARQFSATAVPVIQSKNLPVPVTVGDANSVSQYAGISLYPNPTAAGETTMLKFSNMAAGDYQVSLYNSRAEKISIFNIQHGGGNNTYALPLNPLPSTGVYALNITNKNLKKTIKLQLVIRK